MVDEERKKLAHLLGISRRCWRSLQLLNGICLRYFIQKITYAPPQLVKMFKVFAHGHRDETLFICTFEVNRKLTVGEKLKFKAKSSWLSLLHNLFAYL